MERKKRCRSLHATCIEWNKTRTVDGLQQVLIETGQRFQPSRVGAFELQYPSSLLTRNYLIVVYGFNKWHSFSHVFSFVFSPMSTPWDRARSNHSRSMAEPTSGSVPYCFWAAARTAAQPDACRLRLDGGPRLACNFIYGERPFRTSLNVH